MTQLTIQYEGKTYVQKHNTYSIDCLIEHGYLVELQPQEDNLAKVRAEVERLGLEGYIPDDEADNLIDFIDSLTGEKEEQIVIPKLPEGLDERSNCDSNFKGGWLACWKAYTETPSTPEQGEKEPLFYPDKDGNPIEFTLAEKVDTVPVLNDWKYYTHNDVVCSVDRQLEALTKVCQHLLKKAKK